MDTTKINTTYPEDRLTEAEIKARDVLVSQPGGAEMWFAIKSGFRKAYAMGQADGWTEGYHSGVDDMTGTETLTVVRRNPYRTENR